MAIPRNPFSRKNRDNSESGDNEPEPTDPDATREIDDSLDADDLNTDDSGASDSADGPDPDDAEPREAEPRENELTDADDDSIESDDSTDSTEGSAESSTDDDAVQEGEAIQAEDSSEPAEGEQEEGEPGKGTESEGIASESSEEEDVAAESTADDADLLSDDELDSIDSQVLRNEQQASGIFPPPPLVDGPEGDVGEDGVPGASEENTEHLDEDAESTADEASEDAEEESFGSSYVSPEPDAAPDGTDDAADSDLEQTRVHGFAPLPAPSVDKSAADDTVSAESAGYTDDYDPYMDTEGASPTRREIRAEQEAARKKREKSKRNWIIFLAILVIALLAGAFWLYNAAMESRENAVIEQQEEEEQIETVSIPSAIGFISAEDDDDVACEQYESIGLECSVSYEVDNEIPRGNLISQTPDVGEFVEVGSTVELTYSAGPETSEFPDVNNEALEYVEETLWALGVSIEDIEYTSGSGIPEDRVVEASVDAEETVNNGDSVIIYLSDGTVEIPDWTGETRGDVENESEDLGVDIVFVTEESEEESEGTVLSQSDSGEVQFNDVIEITVAVPFESVEIEVPDILGLSPEEAQSDLAEAGFRSISTLEVSTDEVDEPTVTQVSPGVGGTGMSEERIVIVVSVPSEGNADTASVDNTDDDAEGEEDTE